MPKTASNRNPNPVPRQTVTKETRWGTRKGSKPKGIINVTKGA